MFSSSPRSMQRFNLILASVIILLGVGSLFHYHRSESLGWPSARKSHSDTEQIDIGNAPHDVKNDNGYAHKVEHEHGQPIPQKKPHPWWFIGTVTPASSIQRREIIRSTWQKLYRDDSTFTVRFIISNATDLWRPVIEHENSTYGDLIELTELKEVAKVANTVKTIHLYKYLEAQNRPYAWVSKIDDDSFLDVPAFLKEYLLPRMDFSVDPPVASVNRTIIARELWMGPVKFPGGQFYTLTWDIMQRISELWNKDPWHTLGEDETNGRLLHDANEPWELVKLHNPVAFDYQDDRSRGDGTAWAPADDEGQLNEWRHAVAPGAINPHKMKDDLSYLKVAACYDEFGLMERPPMGEKVSEKEEEEEE